MNVDAKRCSSCSNNVHFRLFQKVGHKAMKICGTGHRRVVGALRELGQQRLSAGDDYLRRAHVSHQVLPQTHIHAIDALIYLR